jgi:hypothetical protein
LFCHIQNECGSSSQKIKIKGRKGKQRKNGKSKIEIEGKREWMEWKVERGNENKTVNVTIGNNNNKKNNKNLTKEKKTYAGNHSGK